MGSEAFPQRCWNEVCAHGWSFQEFPKSHDWDREGVSGKRFHSLSNGVPCLILDSILFVCFLMCLTCVGRIFELIRGEIDICSKSYHFPFEINFCLLTGRLPWSLRSRMMLRRKKSPFECRVQAAPMLILLWAVIHNIDRFNRFQNR